MESPNASAVSEALDEPSPAELLRFPKSRLTKHLEKLDSQTAEVDEHACIKEASGNSGGNDIHTHTIQVHRMSEPFTFKQGEIGPAPTPFCDDHYQLREHLFMLENELYDTFLPKLRSLVPSIMKQHPYNQGRMKEHLERLQIGLLTISEHQLQTIHDHLMSEINHLRTLTIMYQSLSPHFDKLASMISENRKRMEEIKLYRLKGDDTRQLDLDYPVRDSLRTSLRYVQTSSRTSVQGMIYITQIEAFCRSDTSWRALIKCREKSSLVHLVEQLD